MKVYMLMDNEACCGDFVSEFGLSYYIETERHRILFDSGSSSLFAENAKRLGVDLGSVDIAILSHGHSDHGGGLLHFLSVNSDAKIYMAREAFEEHFNADNQYIGLSSDLVQSDRIVYVDGELKIDDEITLVHPSVGNAENCEDIKREDKNNKNNEHDKYDPSNRVYALKYPIETYGLKVYRNGAVVPDDFSHELYLVLNEESKLSGTDKDMPNPSAGVCGSDKHIGEPLRRVVFSGCSHRGILNIMSWFAPDVLFGGFHLFRINTYGEGAETLKNIAEELLNYPTMYYTGHCTGVSQYEFLSSLMEGRIRYLAAGDSVELNLLQKSNTN